MLPYDYSCVPQKSSWFLLKTPAIFFTSTICHVLLMKLLFSVPGKIEHGSPQLFRKKKNEAKKRNASHESGLRAVHLLKALQLLRRPGFVALRLLQILLQGFHLRARQILRKTSQPIFAKPGALQWWKRYVIVVYIVFYIMFHIWLVKTDLTGTLR